MRKVFLIVGAFITMVLVLEHCRAADVQITKITTTKVGAPF